MEKAININRKFNLILMALSFAGFILNCVFYIMLHLKITAGLDIDEFIDSISIYAAVGMILLFIFHISSILAVVFELKVFHKDSLLRSFIFFLSVISLIMTFGDFALLGDIVKEYDAKLIEGIFSEFIILYFSQILHFVFYIFIIILFVITGSKAKAYMPQQQVLKDEAVFIDVQYIGIFTAVMGLAILTALSLFTPFWAIKKGIILLCIVLVLPYATIVVYWLILKIKERITEWYDEKQFQDVTRAGFISFLCSIIILAAFFLVQNLYESFALMGVIWFPLYFFSSLLIFSAVVLYLSKKADGKSGT